MSLSELLFLNCYVRQLLHLWPNLITLVTFITFLTSYYICAFNTCFRNVSMANAAANLPATHPTSLLKAVWRKKLLWWELYTCILVSKVKCSIIYDTVLFDLRHSSFIPGGFRKKPNSWCARIAVNLNVHIQKNHIVLIWQNMCFFRGGYGINAYFQLKNKNVLVVISTFN